MENVWILILMVFLLILLIIVCLLLAVLMRNQNRMAWKLITSTKEQKERSDFMAAQNGDVFNRLQDQLQTLLRQQSSDSSVISIMQDSIAGMNAVMTNAKRRGNWGEYQMETLIRLYAGENPSVYELQYPLENGKIADGVFHLPGSEKVLCIDSKFPMENFLAMQEDPESAEYYQREFRKNMKKHIDDVAGKYITPQTEDLAVLFIPSEAIYQYICGQCDDLLRYALDRHVLLTSPTTLAGVVFTLLSSTRNFFRAANLKEME
ncbi:MAG: DNA recombination protein RmuC, partial [Ileibacterium sp.]|nr:DNA recombination protein RmuC [Ileibacterium sp.]